MKEAMKKTIAKAIAYYNYLWEIKPEEITDKQLLLVAKEYLKEKGYLPTDWAEYIFNKIKEVEDEDL